MSHLDDYLNRWKPHFGKEPWWPMHCGLVMGPGHDWEGAIEAFSQQTYQFAKALGIDTTQVCPYCHQVRDEETTFGEGAPCDLCRQQKSWADEADRLIHVERNIARDHWLSQLTPEERAFELERAHREMRLYLRGLIARDVQ